MDLINRTLPIILVVSILFGMESRCLTIQTERTLIGIERRFHITEELDPPPYKPS